MAKSSRSSARKNNAHRRATNINAPVEQARAERLSAKLVELANAPKPESSDVNMDALNEAIEKDDAGKDEPDADETTMDVDAAPSKPRADRKRITKRKVKKSKIVFKKARDKSSQKKGSKVSK